MQGISDFILKLETEFNFLNKPFGIAGSLVGLAIAVIYCFFGYKFIKAFVALFGAVFGGVLGAVLARLLEFKESWFLVSIVLGMIIFGVLAFFVFKLGVAFMAGVSSFGILMSITKSLLTGNAVWVVAVIAAILVGVITLWAARPVVIITSSFCGGIAAAAVLFHQVLYNNNSGFDVGYVKNEVVFIVGLIIAVFGMIVQFLRKK